jgi:hypothetical protein
LKECTGFVTGSDEVFDPLSQGDVASTSFVQIRCASLGRQTPSGAENSQLAFNGITHG